MPVVDLSAYKPVPATLGDANQIANGMQAIQTALNGLDNNNFAAGLIFDPAKLMQDAATKGQGLSWNGAAWVPAGNISVIDDLTVAGSVLATYDTNTRLGGNIPGTFKDLILVITGRSDQVALQTILCRVNNSAVANYYGVRSYGSGAAETVTEVLAATAWSAGLIPRTAGNVGVNEIVIPNYAGAFNPAFFSHWHIMDNNATGAIYRGMDGGTNAGLGNPITRLQVFPNAGNFVVGTRFTLYGRG